MTGRLGGYEWLRDGAVSGRRVHGYTSVDARVYIDFLAEVAILCVIIAIGECISYLQ
jgi:hypothetical protein